MIKKIYIGLSRILVFFKFLINNKNFSKYIFFLKKNNETTDNNKNIFIFDNFEDLRNTLFRSIYLKIFKKKNNLSLFYINYKFNPIYKYIYKSIGAKHLKIRLNVNQKNECKKRVDLFYKNIQNKNDILNYEIDGLNIGLDIYESYLITFMKPTISKISILNKELFKTVYKSVSLYIFWRDFFVENKYIKGVLISHRNYIETNILNRIAIQHKKKVFTTTGDGLAITRWKNLDLNFFNHYQKIFDYLKDEEKLIALKWSKNQLQKRLSGIIGIDMDYSTKSAFHKNYKEKKNIIKESNKIKILVCTSCFYDNPHCYGKMQFSDFYESLRFLGLISKKTDYEWYFKPHPDFLPGTIETIKEILKYFNNAKLIPSDTSFHFLKDKIDFAITVYGSIGHELPLLDIPVINLSQINPHQNYKFNFTPKNLDELTSCLLNINEVKIKDIEKLYEFYFIHYKFFKPTILFDADLFKENLDTVDIIKNINKILFDKNSYEKLSSRIEKFLIKDDFKTSTNKVLNLLKKIDNENFKNEF